MAVPRIWRLLLHARCLSIQAQLVFKYESSRHPWNGTSSGQHPNNTQPGFRHSTVGRCCKQAAATCPHCDLTWASWPHDIMGNGVLRCEGRPKPAHVMSCLSHVSGTGAIVRDQRRYLRCLWGQHCSNLTLPSGQQEADNDSWRKPKQKGGAANKEKVHD